MCYSVMAIKRLAGLDGPNCCAACAALPTCGAWQVNIEPGSKRNVCALKPVGYKTQPCTNPNVPNTSASGASGRQKPLAPLSAGFPFELRRQDGSYVTARAVVEGATVTLTPQESNNATVRESQSDTSGPFVGYRYAWQPFPLCVLTNGDGLPAAPVSASRPLKIDDDAGFELDRQWSSPAPTPSQCTKLPDVDLCATDECASRLHPDLCGTCHEDSYDHCEALCLANRACFGFVWQPGRPEGNCILKSAGAVQDTKARLNGPQYTAGICRGPGAPPAPPPPPGDCPWLRKHEGRNYIVLPQPNSAQYVDTNLVPQPFAYVTETTFSAVRLVVDDDHPPHIRIDIADTTNSSTEHQPGGDCTPHKNEGPGWWHCGPAYFATAWDCSDRRSARTIVDLRGTPFAVDRNESTFPFKMCGSDSQSTVKCVESDQYCEIVARGGCVTIGPQPLSADCLLPPDPYLAIVLTKGYSLSELHACLAGPQPGPEPEPEPKPEPEPEPTPAPAPHPAPRNCLENCPEFKLNWLPALLVGIAIGCCGTRLLACRPRWCCPHGCCGLLPPAVWKPEEADSQRELNQRAFE